MQVQKRICIWVLGALFFGLLEGALPQVAGKHISLHQACRLGILEDIKAFVMQQGPGCLLQRGEFIPGEERDNSGMLPLALAAGHLHAHLVQWMLEASYVSQEKRPLFLAKLISEQDIDGNTFLHRFAICSPTSAKKRDFNDTLDIVFGCCKDAEELVDPELHAALQDAVHIKNNEGQTALMLAALAGKLSLITRLYEHGALLNEQDNKKNTALTAAAFSGHKDVVLWLLEHNVNPNIFNDQSPLHFACTRAKTEADSLVMVTALLKAGADIHVKNNKGNTPLLGAIHARKTALKTGFPWGYSVIDFLLDRGGRAYKTPELEALTGMEGLTKLQLAALDGKLDDFTDCLRRGADIAARTEDTNKTVLHLAINSGKSEVVALVLRYIPQQLEEKKAFVDAEDKFGYTALDYANRAKATAIIKMLQSNGATPRDAAWYLKEAKKRDVQEKSQRSFRRGGK